MTIKSVYPASFNDEPSDFSSLLTDYYLFILETIVLVLFLMFYFLKTLKLMYLKYVVEIMKITAVQVSLNEAFVSVIPLQIIILHTDTELSLLHSYRLYLFVNTHK